MAVSTDHEIAGGDQPAFSRNLVTDSFSNVEHRRAVPVCEIANPRVERPCSVARWRRVVVQRKEHATRIVQAIATHLLEVVDGHRAGAIRTEEQVDRTDGNLPRPNRVFRVRRENLLTDGERHDFLARPRPIRPGC